MKKIIFAVLGFVAVSSLFISCKDDEETYAEQKEREAKQVRTWLDNHDIDVITVSEFLKDTITNNHETGPDTTRNEYVLFEDVGVYMQIVRRGEGRLIESGETRYYNARYVEKYVGTGDVMTMNTYEQEPDVFYVKRTGGNYSASFTRGIMAQAYGTTVPSAWLMTMPYIKPALLNGSSSAMVRLIAPHNQGTQTAASSVYPAFYEIIITTQQNN
ncbi:MAG: DUF4827 domain-containing protein [Bacteroidaceae bacterium]|nr:DUF4827 domain-containing protein [Bacteroidaceae bacterium]